VSTHQDAEAAENDKFTIFLGDFAPVLASEEAQESIKEGNYALKETSPVMEQSDILPGESGDESFVPESLRGFLEDANSKLEADLSGILCDDDVDQNESSETPSILPDGHMPVSESDDQTEPIAVETEIAFESETIHPEDTDQLTTSSKKKSSFKAQVSASKGFGTPTTLPTDFLRLLQEASLAKEQYNTLLGENDNDNASKETSPIMEQSNTLLGESGDESFVSESLRGFMEDANSKLEADLSGILCDDDVDQNESSETPTVLPAGDVPVSESDNQTDPIAVETEMPLEVRKPEVPVAKPNGAALDTDTPVPVDGDQLITPSTNKHSPEAQLSAPKFLGTPTTLPNDFLRMPEEEQEFVGLTQGESLKNMLQCKKQSSPKAQASEKCSTLQSGDDSFIPDSLRGFLEDANSKLEADLSGILCDDDVNQNESRETKTIILPDGPVPVSESGDRIEPISVEHEMTLDATKHEVPVSKVTVVTTMLPEDTDKLATQPTTPSKQKKSSHMAQVSAPKSLGTPTTLPSDFLRMPKEEEVEEEYVDLTPAESLESMLQCIDSSLVNEIEAITAILGDDAILPRSRSTTSDVELLDDLPFAEDGNQSTDDWPMAIGTASSFDEVLNVFSSNSDEENSKAGGDASEKEVDGSQAASLHGISNSQIRRRKQPLQTDDQDGTTSLVQNRGRKKFE